MKEIKLINIGDKIMVSRTKKDFMIIEVIKDQYGKRLVWSDKVRKEKNTK